MTSPLIRDRGLPRLQPSFRQRAALGGALEWWLVASVVCQQPVTDLVEIVGHDAQADVPLKPRPPFVGTAIQPMMLQGIDVRLNRTMLPPQAAKRLLSFPILIRLGPSPLFRHDDLGDKQLEELPILLRAKPLIHTPAL